MDQTPPELGWLYAAEDGEVRRTQSLRLPRLAWLGNSTAEQSQALTDVLSEGWWDVIGEVTDEWQLHAVLATRLETSARLNGWAEYCRPTALVGLIESAGEQLLLAAGCLVEARLWQANRTGAPAHDAAGEVQLVGDEVAQRASAEASMFYLLATGHAIANIAARALTLRISSHRHARRIYGERHRNATDFAPASNRNEDWRSMNQREAETLCLLAEAISPGGATARNIAAVAATVASSEWHELNAIRQTSWHRLRPRSQGLGGSGTTSELHQVGADGWRLRVLVSPTGDEDNTAAAGPERSADGLTDLALRVALLLSEQMRRLLDLLGALYQERSDGSAG